MSRAAITVWAAAFALNALNVLDALNAMNNLPAGRIWRERFALHGHEAGGKDEEIIVCFSAFDEEGVKLKKGRKSGEGLALVLKCGLLLLSLFVCVSADTTRAGAAQKFDSKKFIVDGGLLFTVDAKGKKTRFEGAEVATAALEDGKNSKRYWFAAYPEADIYKDWESGIYFFGDDGKFISCLKTDDAPWSNVLFSPDGKLFILDSGTGVVRDFGLYSFDGLQLISAVSGLALVDWLDNERFAFTGVDDSHGPRGSDAEIDDWMSVVIYGRGMAEPVVVAAAAATATENCRLESVDRAAGEMEIRKTFVKDVKDWADWEKREETTIKIPIPKTM